VGSTQGEISFNTQVALWSVRIEILITEPVIGSAVPWSSCAQTKRGRPAGVPCVCVRVSIWRRTDGCFGAPPPLGYLVFVFRHFWLINHCSAAISRSRCSEASILIIEYEAFFDYCRCETDDCNYLWFHYDWLQGFFMFETNFPAVHSFSDDFGFWHRYNCSFGIYPVGGF